MTVMAVVGVTVGVAALTITLSVMNGFEQEVRQRIIGADAHLRVQSFKTTGVANADSIERALGAHPEVAGISRFVHVRGLIRYDRNTEGAMIRGFDESTIGKTSNLPHQLVDGKLSVQPDSGRTQGILLGNYLAERLGTTTGDTVQLLTTGASGGFLPQLRTFVVRGIFSTGFYEYDNSVSYIGIQEAARMAGLPEGNCGGFEMRLTDYSRAETVAHELAPVIRFPLYVMTWLEQNRTLFAWMQIEKWATFTVLSLIILVAVVNIISSLVMMVLEKSRDIGILKAMGMSPTSISRVFLWEGGLIGLSGAVFGSLLGFIFCWLQQTLGFFRLPGDVYFIDRMPVQMMWMDFMFVGLIAIALSLLAAWYPAIRASKLDPVVAIRGVE